jgi:hypothetical protein
MNKKSVVYPLILNPAARFQHRFVKNKDDEKKFQGCTEAELSDWWDEYHAEFGKNAN